MRYEVDVLASKNLGLRLRSAFLVLLLVPRAAPFGRRRRMLYYSTRGDNSL